MKKISMLFYVMVLSCVIIICNVGVSKADAIDEPDDSFATSHIDECEYKPRAYTPNETLKLYETPYSTIVTGKIESKDAITIFYTYKDSDGCIWGLYEGGDSRGWLDLSMVTVVYDNYSFNDDNKDNITTTDKTVKPSSNMILWVYPFSEEQLYVFEAEDESSGEDIYLSKIYTDAKKREWGYVGYYMGMEGWICIDDPTNCIIYQDKGAAEEIVETKQPVINNEINETQDIEQNSKSVQNDNESVEVGQNKKDKDSVIVYIVIIALVVVAVGTTLIVVKKHWSKKV